MKRVALVLSSGALFAAASAQLTGPQMRATEPADELDALSQGAETDFPDIETVAERRPVSVTLRALNKVTAKYTDIAIDMNSSARFGALEITARYCDKRPPEEFPETTAFVEIADKSNKRESNLKDAPAEVAPASAEIPSPAAPHAGARPSRALPPDVIFSGWMFASSPALSALEHPVYDVWVIDCKTENVES